MKHKFLAAVCCAMSVFLLSSCRLARDGSGTEFYEDRMIGVFITTNHLDLFDFEGYLNDNINNFSGGEMFLSGDSEKYQGRIYAVLTSRTLTNEETGEQTETQDYVFQDIEGIPYFAATMPATMLEGDSYISSTSDEAISDGHMGIANKDDGKTTTLKGTIFVMSTFQNRVYYLNPVYQSADGSVYLTAGTGLSASMDYEGALMSQSMDSTTTITENGRVTSDSLSITISFSVMYAPEKFVLLQMDTDNALISRTAYAPGQMPEVFVPETNAEYLIIETHKNGIEGEQLLKREIYGKDDEIIKYFIVRADGICIKREMRIEFSGWRIHDNL